MNFIIPAGRQFFQGEDIRGIVGRFPCRVGEGLEMTNLSPKLGALVPVYEHAKLAWTFSGSGIFHHKVDPQLRGGGLMPNEPEFDGFFLF